jgi:tyrosine-protein phosphatase YwqE
MGEATPKSPTVKALMDNAELIQRSEKIQQSIKKINEMKLLSPPKQIVYKLASIGVIPFIQNDTHSIETRNGYSRNFAGNFYNR